MFQNLQRASTAWREKIFILRSLLGADGGATISIKILIHFQNHAENTYFGI